jgi:hypothetical protein
LLERRQDGADRVRRSQQQDQIRLEAAIRGDQHAVVGLIGCVAIDADATAGLSGARDGLTGERVLPHAREGCAACGVVAIQHGELRLLRAGAAQLVFHGVQRSVPQRCARFGA